MNQTIQELYERKSVRAYEERPIEPEKKEMVIQAAIQAPSAGNMTLYSIIDVTDQKLKDTLAVTCDNQPFIAKAPMVLVFCADYRKWYDLFLQHEEEVRKPGMGDFMLASCDALIAAQNAVVAASAWELDPVILEIFWSGTRRTGSCFICRSMWCLPPW